MVQVKLGGNKSRGFYPETDKEYTQIQKAKMPYNTLNVLYEYSKNPISRELGIGSNVLSREVYSIQPELKMDKYGELVSMKMLLKDFEKAGLICWKNKWNIAITSLGKQFLLENVIEE